ncbi:MAG TPA: hypothetical protein VK994_06975, partial [Bacteroidales bacterium]|nr:hypothetical protein [Bacteroidales bacterium]
MAGTLFTPFIYGLLLFIFGVIYYLRMRLWHAPALMFLTAITLCWYFLAMHPAKVINTLSLAGMSPGDNFPTMLETYFTLPLWFILLAANFISYFTLGPAFLKALDLEGAAIRIFKVSARTVSGTENGYTERPLSSGTHALPENELISFAAFLETKKICLAQYPGQGIKLLFSMGPSPLNYKNRDKASWVMFGYDGNLAVFISESDYRQYRRKYTFDQLCDRLGATFLRFAAHHSK